MHFTKSIPGAIAIMAAGTAASQFSMRINSTLSGVDVNNLGYTELISFANSTIWIGGIKSEIYSEPFLPVGGQTGFAFTSYHGTPTGWQDMYLYPNETMPIGFTTPHSAFIPVGASTYGFSYNADGYLVYNNVNKFYGCQSVEQSTLQAYQIYWFGNGAPNGVSCVGPLFIQQDGGVDTIE